jgi:hypothetical protein
MWRRPKVVKELGETLKKIRDSGRSRLTSI